MITYAIQEAPHIAVKGLSEVVATFLEFISIGAVLLPLAYARKLRRIRLAELARRDEVAL